MPEIETRRIMRRPEDLYIKSDQTTLCIGRGDPGRVLRRACAAIWRGLGCEKRGPLQRERLTERDNQPHWAGGAVLIVN